MNYDELRKMGEEYLIKNNLIEKLNTFRNDPDNGCQEEVAKVHSHRRQVDAYEVAIAVALIITNINELDEFPIIFDGTRWDWCKNAEKNIKEFYGDKK